MTLLAVVTTETASPASAAPYCGTKTYFKSNGKPYVCTFADYFSGSSLDRSKWRPITSAGATYGDRKDCFVDNPANIAVNNGSLALTTRKVATPFQCGPSNRRFTATATSGMVSTMGHFNQAYGRWEIRAKFPYTTARGLQSAIWMWPKGASGAAWPMTGEIDIAEWYSYYPDRVIPYLHYGTSFLTPSQATNNYCLVPNVDKFHTYVLEWNSKSLTISYDGKVCLRNTSVGLLGSAPFNKPFYLTLTHALGLDRNAPTGSTPYPSTMRVDWVKVWG